MPERFRDEVLLIKALYKSTVTLLTENVTGNEYHGGHVTPSRLQHVFFANLTALDNFRYPFHCSAVSNHLNYPRHKHSVFDQTVRITNVFLYLYNYVDKLSPKSAGENQKNCYVCAQVHRHDKNVKFAVL